MYFYMFILDYQNTTGSLGLTPICPGVLGDGASKLFKPYSEMLDLEIVRIMPADK